jgi:cell wall-associated NlpC family hydrolase
MREGCDVRKTWVAVGVGTGGFGAFVALLVVGTYIAAASLGSGAAVRLAEGAVPAAYDDLVQRWGTMCPALNPALLAAQLYQESGWRPDAHSSADARGIAQFIPGTWAVHGVDGDHDGDRDVWDPKDAIPSAASYDCELAADVADVPGDPTDNMLAAYNAGPYAVIKYGGVPPYRQTRNYVATIRKLEKSFAAPRGRVDPSRQAAGAINFAQEKLGTPYLWGGDGTAADSGRFDCSGLTKAAYASVGVELPRVANDQWNAGPHPGRDELLPGDLVFFAYDLQDPRSIHHVGIYVGGGYMIDAPYTGAKIRFDPIDSPDYFGATRPTTG